MLDIANTGFIHNAAHAGHALTAEDGLFSGLARRLSFPWVTRAKRTVSLASAPVFKEQKKQTAGDGEHYALLSQVTDLSFELVADLEEKKDKLDLSNSELSKANARASALSDTLDQRVVQIAKLKTALAHTTAEVTELQTKLEQRESQLAELQNEVEKKEEVLAKANESLCLADLKLRRQTELLRRAEQQRLMADSLGRLCHQLGQPFTVVALHLDLLHREETRPQYKGVIKKALLATEEVRLVFQRAHDLKEFRAEPYIDITANALKADRALDLGGKSL